MMQDGSYLINISRGGIIDERALYQVLRSGKLAGAGLDVWEIEEKGLNGGYPTEYPLHNFNVIMTPHYSGATKESRERALINIGENLRRFIKGEQLLGLADLESGY
jgi:phosphoglycerate dehydrogenase-like enzyme